MPPRLERRQTTGNFHSLTFSCHNRLPLLATPEAKSTFLAVLEQTRNPPARPIYNHAMTSAEQLINELAYATVDNEPGSVAKLQQVAAFFKTSRWPAEYGRSTQALHPATLNRLEKDSRRHEEEDGI